MCFGSALVYLAEWWYVVVQADAQTKVKLECMSEIKQLNSDVMTLKSEISKNDESLKELAHYKSFLTALSPKVCVCLCVLCLRTCIHTNMHSHIQDWQQQHVKHKSSRSRCACIMDKLHAFYLYVNLLPHTVQYMHQTQDQVRTCPPANHQRYRMYAFSNTTSFQSVSFFYIFLHRPTQLSVARRRMEFISS